MWDILGVREKVVEKVRKFYPNAVIFTKALDLFKSTSRVSQVGGFGASASNASTLFSFCSVLFIFRNISQAFVP